MQFEEKCREQGTLVYRVKLGVYGLLGTACCVPPLVQAPPQEVIPIMIFGLVSAQKIAIFVQSVARRILCHNQNEIDIKNFRDNHPHIQTYEILDRHGLTYLSYSDPSLATKDQP